MHLRLFGPPALTLDVGGTLPFAPERRFRLLALLALERQWVPRERLAALFWPGRSGPAARANLRKLLLELRALAVPGLEESPAGLRWAVPSDLAAHEAALDRGDCEAATEAVTGLPLQGLEAGSGGFDDWLGGERARLLGRWRTALLAAVDAAEPAQAARWCERLLAIDPLDEEAMALRARAAPACGLAARVQGELQRFGERLAQELGVEPSQRLREAAAALERGPPPPAVPAPPLLGRAAELAQAQALLADPGCRLLTLLGPGGVGKTRLAQALAQAARAAGQGVWWVPLEDLLTPAELPGRIGEHVRPGLALPADGLDFLAHHWPAGPGLLVLDGFEAVIDAGPGLQRLLDIVPALRVLVTSRERLDLAAEWLLPLAGLGAPPPEATAAEVLAHPAVQLFVQRARRLDPAFEPASDGDALRRLCARTDGLPLALELAAAWVRLLPLAQIAQDLADGGGWLAAGGQALRAGFERSWALLTPAERRGFARLAVFRGGFTREAAEQVAGVALPVLASLVDKSMLRRAGPGRFDRHALAHAFARERLAAEPAEQQAMAERHARWALAYWQRHHGGRHGDHARQRAALAAERDNLLQAWQHWTAQADAAALEAAAEPLSWFHVVEGRLPDALDRLAAAEAAPGLPATTAALLRAHRAWLTLWLGQPDEAERLAVPALQRLEAAGHRAGTLLALRTLAHRARGQGRHAESAALLDRAVRLARPDPWALAVMLDARAMAWTMLGRYRQAIASVRRALEINTTLGHEAQCMYNEFNLAQAHGFAGDAAAARPWAEASLARARRIGYRFFEPYTACQRALLRLQQGELDGAAADAAAARAVAEAMAGQPALPWALEIEARVALVRGDAEGACALAQQGLALARAADARMMVTSLWPVLAAAQAAGGDRAAAEATLARLDTDPPPQAPAQAEARALRARWRQGQRIR